MTASERAIRVLILGGTAEARELASVLADRPEFNVTLSLAGRTASPLPHAVPVRSGGFGGADGLAATLRAERIAVLVDATHPYAAIMSANAVLAAASAGVDLLALRRAAWTRRSGDNWIEVGTAAEAAGAIGDEPRRVFLALGRKELAPFAAAPQHIYLVRSVDPVEKPLDLPNAAYISARGPFREADDRALLEENGIEILVSKNSGGDASYSKIAAARALGIPVVMLKRPCLPDVASVESVGEIVAWLDHAITSATARGV